MAIEMKTRDELREMLRAAVIADPDPDLDGKRGELGAVDVHAHPMRLHHVYGASWTFSCIGASPAILAALKRHVPGLQARYGLR